MNAVKTNQRQQTSPSELRLDAPAAVVARSTSIDYSLLKILRALSYVSNTV
ncbi:hypothetical protein N9F33_02360 [Pseudomonadales bacterium]|nr:hypothetical protein [Pseudomonadales bacterium]